MGYKIKDEFLKFQLLQLAKLVLDVEESEEEVLIPCLKKFIFLSLTIERPSELLNSHLFSNDYFFVKNSLYDSFYVHKSIDHFDEIEKSPFSQLPAKNF